MKSLISFFTEIEKHDLKIHMESQNVPDRQSNLWRKRKVNISISVFKLYYRALINIRIWNWYPNRNAERWNRTQNPVTNLQPQILDLF